MTATSKMEIQAELCWGNRCSGVFHRPLLLQIGFFQLLCMAMASLASKHERRAG